MDILLIIAFIIMFPVAGWLLDDDHWVFPGLINIAIIWFYLHKNDIHLWAAIKNNPQQALGVAVAYIAIGLVWALVKISRRATKIDAEELATSYRTHTDEKDIDDKLDTEFTRAFSCVPMWIAFWPWVLAWDILSDFLKSFFEWVADVFKGTFKFVFLKMASSTKEEALQKIHSKTDKINKENPFND